MSSGKGDRNRTADHDAYGRGIERIKRDEKRRREQSERHKEEQEETEE